MTGMTTELEANSVAQVLIAGLVDQEIVAGKCNTLSQELLDPLGCDQGRALGNCPKFCFVQLLQLLAKWLIAFVAGALATNGWSIWKRLYLNNRTT